jgi:hypothetical protein
MLEQVLSAAHVFGVSDRPKRHCSVAKTMQVDRKAERLAGPPANHIVDRSVVHRPTLIRGPETSVSSGPGNAVTKFVEVSVDPRGQLSRKRKIKRLPVLGILRSNIERPKVS